MICFIILHYMVKNETLACVKNIKALSGEKKIVIVDNCSPDGSGKELLEEYRSDPDVIIYLNDENSGFARGNNIGCKIAESRFNPDLYVVMNNDIEIQQTDFTDRIIKIWNEERFDVLGPDIYSISGKIHQSPKNLENMTIEKAKALQTEYQRKLHSHIMVPLRCYLKQIRFLKTLYNQKRAGGLHIDYGKKYYNVPLHGSCLIFSRNFIGCRENTFFPKTFFYFESEILDYECQKSGMKEMYDPSVKVYHHQNVSTNITYRNALQKVRFMNEQNYNSITEFIKEYGDE